LTTTPAYLQKGKDQQIRYVGREKAGKFRYQSRTGV
jgi:hypothetical protein